MMRHNAVGDNEPNQRHLPQQVGELQLLAPQDTVARWSEAELNGRAEAADD